MKVAALVALVVLGIVAAAAAALAFVSSTGTGETDVQIEPLTTFAPPVELTKSLPSSWVAGLARSQGGETLLLSCGDTDGDGALTGADGAMFDDVLIALDPAKACSARGR